MIYFQLQAGSVNSLTNGEAQSLKVREHATQHPLAEIASFTSQLKVLSAPRRHLSCRLWEDGHSKLEATDSVVRRDSLGPEPSAVPLVGGGTYNRYQGKGLEPRSLDQQYSDSIQKRVVMGWWWWAWRWQKWWW